MGKVKDTSYFVVQGWMLNQLHLKGNTLQVFAIIHGFSHSEDNEYKGSLQYLFPSDISLSPGNRAFLLV